MTQPAFIYQPYWIAGDVLIWSSRCAPTNTLPDGHGSSRVAFNRVAVS